MRVPDAYKPVPASIEVRSIDYVPDGERHSGLASQFTLWLAANLQITAIVTGALAVVFGGDVFWSLVALLLGQLIGGAVMALHAAGVRGLYSVSARSVHAVERDQSDRLLLLHSVALRCAGVIRSRWRYGRYGRWNMTGIMIYLIGILVQIPFLSTAFYTGPLVEPLGGVDISWIVGLLVPGVLYYVFGRASLRRAPPQLILPG